MSRTISRRDLIAGGAGLAVAARASSFPGVFLPSATKPVVVSSSNGHIFKNGGPRTCVQEAFLRLSGGTDVLEALVAGVAIPEQDPTETSVGYGGLPNAEGVVQLDSCVMHGAKRWAGGVACLEGVRTPAAVALRVAGDTDHHLLVGKGAQDFARRLGFTIEADLNTDTSRKAWLEWKRRTDPDHYLDPGKRSGGRQALLSMIQEGLIDPLHAYGTINCNGLNEKGEIAGVTTTSGLAFKIPGRVGDSPILGAGLYVDGAVGAAGSTGRGEANLYGCLSFLIVEELRRGVHPKDAGMAAMKRMKANTFEKRLKNEKGEPNFGMEYYVLDVKGRHAGISTNKGSRYAVCDENGARLEPCEYAWG
ncbi:MAG: N(4)-(beta-N-acetylglucosaminyl)-L-asparaginase [Armatimonadetes bacterium]|nr:N(4)-(beta-N-acetylglucosaminyl)-L-asparaginase [Armatimonadota bacterium]